ncbi:MAG TPA: CHASE2 domain-containing protein, partial [Armatimonadota bacterium]|nr:CHASE2 domain-containing protein [Armatimonadota bacterium]
MPFYESPSRAWDQYEPPGRMWDYSLVDLRYQLRGRRPDSGQVMVVGITHECQQDPLVGTLPLPRAKYADAIEKLNDLGASVICFDIFFPETDDRVNNAALAAAIAEAGNVILPIFDEKEGRDLHDPKFRGSMALIADAALDQGHINVSPDGDGAVRRAPLIIRNLRALTRYTQLGVTGALHHMRRSAASAADLTGVSDETVHAPPTSADGELMVNWRRPEDGARVGLTFLTFRDLMNDRIPEALISGKVVFIGQTATGVLNADMFEGPFDSQFGVFIQADVADSVIAGEHVRAFPPGAHLALLLLLCTVLGGTLLSVRLQPLLITYP